MALYRGPGGAGDATNDATSQAILAAASAAAAANSEAAAASSAVSAANSATAASSSASAAASSESSVAANASNAATSATNAATSATAAANSASAASTSETNAASSASAAATSATNAANSATSAANSATTATTQATNASNSATAAATSATNAANSATAAATSEANAAVSETNAAASETNAATSATNAASSATSASVSASTATTQATNAASSATAAATSATNAANSATSASTSASTATTQATNAATSATNSANSATASASSATNAAASAAAAAASLDSFDDRYLGSKTADPTLDNDGNALVTGALYYNSVAGEMRVYDGSLWIPASAATQAILTVYRYTATAGQTTFSGNDDNSLSLAYTVGSAIVTLNGVTLEVGTDVTATTGTSIVLAVGAAAGDEVNIYAFSTFDVANTYTKSEADTKYLTKVNPSYTGTLTGGTGIINIGSGQFYKDSSGNVGIGTSSPGAKLDVVGVTRSLGYSLSGTGVAGGTTAFSAGTISTDSNWGMYFRAPTGSSASAEYAWVNAAGSERMRIDSSGNLLVGTTAGLYAATPRLNVSSSLHAGWFVHSGASTGSYSCVAMQRSASTGNFAEFWNQAGNTPIGAISTANNTTVSYGTASDYRLKENIQPMQDALEFVRKQRPVTYDWKADGSKGSGYIAHWLQEDGADNCVTGEKDAVDEDGKPLYQGIDTSFMVAPLNAAMIELADIVDAQKQMLDLLKAELDVTKAEVAELKKGTL